MPELTFVSRWPDGHRLASYSPSLVVSEHLDAGAWYPVADFVRRSGEALRTASARVEARYGFPCGRAAASLAEIEAVAARYPGGEVLVERLTPRRGAA
ncbi:MSMEG_0570 family nitrogen starvation response protein [uncultured Friedmanniella sp.]|uniref:MSMEG_0570 family nitrogen starvation response protein n=1 Tax=uncultured Friedmanniella sp. TaxID=335381 RepID=UPI0035CAA551